MRLPRFLLALAAPLVVACGIGTSQVGPRGGGGGGDDAGPDAGCPSGVPTVACYGCNGGEVAIECVNGAWSCPPTDCPAQGCTGPEPTCTGCSGETVSPQCVGETWECPVYGCPVEFDGGCGNPPPDICTTLPPCAGGYWEPLCNGNGSWTCNPVCPINDGGPIIDDAGPPDVTPRPIFACVSIGCDPEGSYCQITTGGPVVPDAGGVGAQCIPLPSTCAPGAATCACVQAVQGIGCSCVEQHGDVTITCEIP